MLNKYTVSLSTLRAARTHAAEKDIRSYLCGVYLDTKAGKVVATDGHRLFCANARGVKLGAPSIIIPNDLIDAALKQFTGEYARGKTLGDADVLITVADDQLCIRTPSGSVFGRPLSGTFPDWRRVVPKGDEAADPDAGHNLRSVCNYQYIADACDAILTARNKTKKAATSHAVRVHYRGELPAIICDGGADVLVIVMPMRHEISAEAHVVACRMAHDDALGYDAETQETVAAEAA